MHYYKYHTTEQVKEQLVRRLENAIAAEEAWKKVVVNRKKNGEEFAQLSRAIDGARLTDCYGMMYLTVYYQSHGYQQDEFLTYGYIDELPEDDPRRAGKPLHSGYTREKYDYTAEELREKIAGRIDYWHNIAEEYKADLQNIDAIVTEYRNAVAEADKRLRERASMGLYYLVTE